MMNTDIAQNVDRVIGVEERISYCSRDSCLLSHRMEDSKWDVIRTSGIVEIEWDCDDRIRDRIPFTMDELMKCIQNNKCSPFKKGLFTHVLNMKCLDIVICITRVDSRQETRCNSTLLQLYMLEIVFTRAVCCVRSIDE